MEALSAITITLAVAFALGFQIVVARMGYAHTLAHRIKTGPDDRTKVLTHFVVRSVVIAFVVIAVLELVRHWAEGKILYAKTEDKSFYDNIGGFCLLWAWSIGIGVVLMLRSITEGVHSLADVQDQKGAIQTAYGAKTWATHEQIMKALKRANDGIYIGGGQYFFNDQGNILTVGGPRGGKGVNLILGALLSDCLQLANAASWIILDPKGENCAVSADYLKQAGYKVYVINPFGIPEIERFGNSRFNVFDLFNINDAELESFVSMVVFALLPTSKDADQFFTTAGRDLISTHIRYMMAQDDEPKTFKTLYNWLHFAGTQRDDLLLKMTSCTALDGVIQAGAMSMVGLLNDDAGKTVGNIYKTASQAVSVFGDSRLRESVGGSDFTLGSISQQKTAVFICINPREMNRAQAWLRIVFNSLLDNMLRGYNPKRKVVVLMDEFAKLGSLKTIQDNVSFLPGYNCVIWPIVQDLGQLKDLYPNNWETFLGSATVTQYLTIRDNFTAEYIAKRMPKVIKFVGEHDNGKPKEIQVPLLSQEEIIGFPDIILEINGMETPAQIRRKPYWEINKNAAENPFR